ncbi:DNA primase [Mycoplasma sp. 2575]
MQESVWEYVISKSDIVNIIGQYLTLMKQGKNYKACCPFHGEKTPSFVVSPEQGIFKCFGCGKGGDVIKFIQYKENLTSFEALKFLVNKQNLDISKFGNFMNNSAITTEHSKILEVNKVALNFFRYQITFEKSAELIKYLHKRNLNDNLIKEFQIGFSSKNKSIYETLIEHKFDSFEISNSSLLSSIENKNFFNDRLMFPICDELGNIIAFSGRDITGLQNPKYLNSSETIVFRKNEVIFNYFHAKDEINNKREVYLVEGQFDCIAMFKAGFKNAVAIMGTSLSPAHLKLLNNKTITLFFDNDSAGQNATLKNLRMILYYSKKYNLNAKFVINTLNKDADELYNLDNGLTLKKMCENKVDIVEYLLILAKQNILNNKQSFERNEIFKQIFEYVYYIDNSLVLMLKERFINENILTADLFENYYKNSNPLFLSDPLFKNKINEKKHSTNHPSIYTNENYDNNFFIKNDIASLQPEVSKQANSPSINKKNKKFIKARTILKQEISRHYMLLKEILLLVLNQPFIAKQWKNDGFHDLNLDDDSQKILRKLISYIIKKNKEGLELSQSNLVSVIESDLNKAKISNNIDLINEYKSYLEQAIQIKNLTLTSDDLKKDIKNLYDRVDEFVENRKKPKKQILMYTKGAQDDK